MEAKELRIGNYVNYHIVDDERKEWNEINEVDIDDIYTVLMGNADDLSPIPLSDEWLDKFGMLGVSKNGFTVVIKPIAKRPIYRSNNYYTIYMAGRKIELKYVHQLQNLYFALTGEELIFEKK